MISRLSKQIQRRRFYLGLSMIVVIQAAGLVGYFQFGQIWYAWGGLLGSLLIALGLGWLVRQTLKKPLADLTAVCRTLATDCEALSKALGELARGNLTAHVTVQSQPIDLSVPTEASPLVEVFNTTVANIRAAAGEFNEVTYEPLQRLCYVGADSYLEGRISGEAMGQALGGGGQVVLTLAFFELAPLALRRKGFESVLREKYPGIQIIDVAETSWDPRRAYACAQTILKRYPDLAGIYVTDGLAGPSVARAVAEAGAAGRVKIICHDLIDETMRYLQQGVITATLSQDLFTQGHDSVIHLFNHLATGWRPSQPRLLTRLQLVTCDNYEQYWQPGRGLIESAAASEWLAQPIGPASRPLRIAVQNREMSEVDRQLQAGTLAAAAELRSYNANVELISGGAVRVEPIIESVVAQGYDALLVLAANKKDVLALNRAAAAGVAVSTYNSEPLSLRGLVALLADHAPPYMTRELEGAHKPIDQRSQQQKEIVRQAIGFMHENLEAPIGVADVARSVGLTPSYFCRLFTEQTGRNPRDFLIDIRIERAKEYLAHTGMSVMDVCVALGYSPSYFSRLFKHRVGCTPGQYAQWMRSP